jgi:putative oxidoreductase
MSKKLIGLDFFKKWQDCAPLALRFGAGIIFIAHGWMKVENGMPATAEFFTRLGIPMPMFNAYFVTSVELLGGIFLILGILTRLSSLALAVDMLVAMFTVHVKNGFFVNKGGYEFVLLLFAVCVYLMLAGGGKYSLDRKWLEK